MSLATDLARLSLGIADSVTSRAMRTVEDVLRSLDRRLSTLEAGQLGRGGKVGFYTTSPVARPSAVPVSAAGIHAALVSLGLITA